ncbi:MAG: DUF1207 domain-containing protein [Nitrospira sp. WS238]|nr:DUF1207 domain-containing protein [Nitrospira sp. WS238]
MAHLALMNAAKPATVVHNPSGVFRLLMILLVVGMVLLDTESASSRPASDEYILGFASSVLRREFNVIDATLTVRNGVIMMQARDLQGIDREKLKRTLGSIEGVRRVDISETDATTAPARSDDTHAADVSEGSTGFLPRGLLFVPLHADPRWPHFSASYRGYRTNDLTAAFAGNFGETISLYRNKAPLSGQWELILQAGVFSLFDLSATSLDLVNADYHVGLLTAYRSGNVSAFLRLHHQSSHLGDEFLLGNPGVERINLSYEELDVKVAYEAFDWMRVYGGGGYLVHRHPTAVEPITTQWGIELTSPIQFFSGAVTPICYADFQSTERSQWAIAQSIMAGLRFENPRIGNRQIQLLAQYFAGPSPDGQFYTQHSNWFGIGLHLYY